MDPGQLIQAFVVGFIPFLFALCVHEYAHGWVANKLGDPTAKLMGRLTLNPAAHADMLGTIALPLIGMFTGLPVIGWAKPVPVNGRNLKNERVGMFWVALAGPGSNLLMALIGVFIAVGSVKFVADAHLQRTLQDVMLGTRGGLSGFVGINLMLAAFNLIPLNPLDGGKIFAIFLPENMNRRLDELQAASGFLILILFATGIISVMIVPIMRFFYTHMLEIAGYVLGVGV